MPGLDPVSTSMRARFFAGFGQRIVSLLSIKRVGWSLVGTFAFVGAAAALNANSPVSDNSGAKITPQNTATTQQNAAQTDTTSGTTSSDDSSAGTISNTSFSSHTSSTSGTNVQLNVNGQDIPVPGNTSNHQTIINSDGSHTTIDTSSDESSEGTVSNSSTSNFSVQVNTHSSTSGGSTTK